MRPLFEIGRNMALWFAGMVVIVFFYGLGKINPLDLPLHELPLTALERAVPLVPWTVWLYGTITWVSLACWIAVPDRREAARLLLVIAGCSAVCSAVFVVFPTTFPRALWPLPDVVTDSVRELGDLRDTDSPTNCFPSLHVALAWGIALSWTGFLRRRWLRPWPLVWAAVVTACTLTTKQHYLVDIPSGLAVGVAVWYGVRRVLPDSEPLHILARPFLLRMHDPARARRVARLRGKVEAHQWSLSEVAWPTDPLPPMDPTLVRLINEIIYIEEIAGMNFRILARASGDEDLQVLYTLFADEERRHADGLRKVLALHHAPLRTPGLGNTLVLGEFETLDHRYDADVYLVAVANPVFETFLDAGTIPFLRNHPALASDWFEDFVGRTSRDESAHLALNWLVIRDAARSDGGLWSLRLLLNPSVYRGMIAVPFMSLDVYCLAHRLGYEFRTLLPAFKKLWHLHERYEELAHFPLWWVFRWFVVCGYTATVVSDALQRAGLMFIRFWTTFTAVTDRIAWLLFGRRLLERRDLPVPPR